MATPLPDIYRRFVDGILIINMDANRERYASVTQAVATVLPSERVERLSAVVGRELPGCGELPWFSSRTGARAKYWAAVGGCALSHRNGIALAKERGWKRVLLLEDDVRPTPVSEENAALLETALSHLSGPYILHIGYNCPVPHGHRVLQQETGSLWRIDGVLGAHAYIVSAEAYDTLLARLPEQESIWEWVSRYRAVDTFYREYAGICGLLPVYAVYPHLFSQADGYSEIEGTVVNRAQSAGAHEPYPVGLLRLAMTPFRRLKVRLNSLRTILRAERGGLPGYRRRRASRETL